MIMMIIWWSLCWWWCTRFAHRSLCCVSCFSKYNMKSAMMQNKTPFFFTMLSVCSAHTKMADDNRRQIEVFACVITSSFIFQISENCIVSQSVSLLADVCQENKRPIITCIYKNKNSPSGSHTIYYTIHFTARTAHCSGLIGTLGHCVNKGAESEKEVTQTCHKRRGHRRQDQHNNSNNNNNNTSSKLSLELSYYCSHRRYR